MELLEYIDINRRALDEFWTYWNEQNEADSKNFVMDMELGEWDEQFQAFCELRENQIL